MVRGGDFGFCGPRRFHGSVPLLPRIQGGQGGNDLKFPN